MSITFSFFKLSGVEPTQKTLNPDISLGFFIEFCFIVKLSYIYYI